MPDVNLLPPLKGVNRNLGRTAQPEGTCYDALNVLPIDRQGRFRIAQRGGVGEVEDLGTSETVDALLVAGTVNPDFGASTAVYSVDFTDYAGTSVTNIDDWYANTGIPYNFQPGTNDSSLTGFACDANGLYAGAYSNIGAGTDNMAYAVKPLANLPDDFTAVLTFSLNANSLASAQEQVSFTWHVNGSSATAIDGSHFVCRLNARGTITVYKFRTGFGPFTYPNTGSFSPLAAGEHVLRVDVNQTAGTITVYLDGVLACTNTGVTPIPSYTKSVGIQLDYLIQSDANDRVKSLGIFPLGVTEGASVGGINRTISRVVASSGGLLYVGDTPSSLSLATGSSSNQMSTNYNVQGTVLNGSAYFVDGSDDITILNLSTDTVSRLSASAGTAPTGCTLAATWRGRLVLSGAADDAQNFYASRVDDPTDWDYSQTDSATAFAGNAAPAGRVGAPILALAPLSDDILMIFGEQSIYAVRGDPADGGSIDLISNSAGISGPNAWCRDAAGYIYFVGPSGLYRANPDGSAPQELSRDVWRQFFTNINRSLQHITLVYDQLRYGVWIFVAPEDSDDAPGYSLFYDVRAEGYWPIEFTNAPTVGPTCAVYYDGFDDDNRYPLLGSYDGKLNAISFTTRRDLGEPIESLLQFTPFNLSQTEDMIMTRIDITGGEVGAGDDVSVWNMNLTVKGGKTAYAVTEGTANIEHSFSWPDPGRQLTRVTRIRGGWFSLLFFNTNDGDYFSFEQAMAKFIPAGTQR